MVSSAGAGTSAVADASMAVVCTAGMADGRAAGKRGARVAGNAACVGRPFTLVGATDVGRAMDTPGASASSNACTSTGSAAGIANEPVAGRRSGRAASNATGAGPPLATY